jgi:hypothetical protein
MSDLSQTQYDFPIRYEIRYIGIPQPDDMKEPLLPQIVKFVESALATVGFGSVAASADGLQLTAPVDIVHNLVATIKDYAKIKPLFQGPLANQLYVPGVEFANGDADLIRIIDALGLRPADMRCTFEKVDSGGKLIFSGPADRASEYVKDVLPSIRALVGLLDSDKF